MVTNTRGIYTFNQTMETLLPRIETVVINETEGSIAVSRTIYSVHHDLKIKSGHEISDTIDRRSNVMTRYFISDLTFQKCDVDRFMVITLPLTLFLSITCYASLLLISSVLLVNFS